MSSSVKFNAIVFEDAIHRAWVGEVKGYAVAIADEDGIQAKVSGGWAQAPGDGNVPMKTYVSSCIGSVSKVHSAIALLHLFDRHQLKDATVQEQLDERIWDKLPPKWRQTLAGKNIDGITYRQLLQHRSGIRDPNTIPDEYKDIRLYYVLSQSVKTSNIGNRKYHIPPDLVVTS